MTNASTCMRLVQLKIPDWIGRYQPSPRSRQPTQSPPVRLPLSRGSTTPGSPQFGRSSSGFQRPVWHQYPDNFSNCYNDLPPIGPVRNLVRPEEWSDPSHVFQRRRLGSSSRLGSSVRLPPTQPSYTLEHLIRDWKLFGVE